MKIEKVNELTGKILDAQSKAISLEYKIAQIEKPDSQISARLHLEINNNRRSSIMHYLSKEEVLPLLKNWLLKTKKEFADLQSQYAEKTKR